MSTRNGRKYRNCEPCAMMGVVLNSATPYLSQLVDNIALSGSAIENMPPDYIVYALAVYGGIAYIADTNEWTIFTPADKNQNTYNGLLPETVKLYSYAQERWSEPINCKAANIKIFPANATFYPVIDKINELAESLETVEDNISQNLDNLRQMAVVVTKDKRLRNQLISLNKQRLCGQSHGVVLLPEDDDKTLLSAETANEALTVVSLSPNAENYLDTYLTLKADYRQELHNVIGVTEVAEKSERRITSEMELIENSTYAFIDMIINNINKYAKYHNVEIYAHRQHSACAEHADPTIEAAGITVEEEGHENVNDGNESE